MSSPDSVFSVFVVGPTASGKSDLAVSIAEKYNGSTKFCFDSAEQSFITRIKLVLPKNGSVIA